MLVLVTAFLVFLLASPTVFEDFGGSLSVERWYVGVPGTPKKGVLKIPRDGWIVSRGLPDEGIETIEIEFAHKGGALEVAFFAEREPLSSPRGTPVRVQRAKGIRVLSIGKAAAIDGAPLDWSGSPSGTFRLRALKGAIEIHEVRVAPRLRQRPQFSELERATVHFVTAPPIYRDGSGAYQRQVIPLWDVEVCVLFRRGETAFDLLRARPRGSPALVPLVRVGDGRALSLRAASSPLAMRDWGDERGNLAPAAFQSYLAREYATFEVLMQAQRALNATVEKRKGLQALVHLAVIRHAANARAACALAETQGNKAALAALKKVLGGADYRRLTGDKIRLAAGKAARLILDDRPPPEWKGFRFDPQNRFLTLTRAQEFVR